MRWNGFDVSDWQAAYATSKRWGIQSTSARSRPTVGKALRSIICNNLKMALATTNLEHNLNNK
jgi:hypothetical protein